ncbi:MAG: fumarate hydratase [Oscillospiraceae bacterium]|jgi:fumarate hydratase subunit alpha
MREISCETIAETIEKLCIEAAVVLPPDVCARIDAAAETEASPYGRAVLKDLHDNFVLAKQAGLPVCQDTGMAVVFAELGQEVHIAGGSLEDAVNEGVRRGYEKGYLRKSVVKDPLRRVNTGDNTPAVLHLRLVSGDRLKLTVAPKGFGSENMSAMKLLLPSASPDEVLEFIVETVDRAGSNPCPPVVVGVGLGGTIETAALLAKTALCRPLNGANSDPFYAALEKTALERVNALGTGPQGFGGTTTALAVNIETYPTHIAGLPCVVNMGCHATRHASATL